MATQTRMLGLPQENMSTGTILAVSLNPKHSFSKRRQPSIHLLAGLGVEGDAHCGATVRHRYLVRRNPAAPNRSQVHLLEAEFLDILATELSSVGSALAEPLQAGDLGENITTRSLDLLALPAGTRLHLGQHAIVELTGLRTPCKQLDTLRPGLMKASFLPGTRRPRAGVMAVVLQTGVVAPNDTIMIKLPQTPHHPLRPI